MTPINSLSGQTVCITGSLTGYTRSEATALLRSLGCRVTKKVSRVTDILIIANTYETTEKMILARQYGTEIMKEREFLQLIKSAI